MKVIYLVFILLSIILIQSCKNSTGSNDVVKKVDSLTVEHKDQEKTSSDDLPAEHNGTQPVPILQTHLQDTISMKGDFILFLQPDSARFESLEDEPGIYDGDSDFGIGISNTIIGLSKSKQLNKITVRTSDKRFINISDCKECPVIIDRDTVNYGFILSGTGRAVQTKYHEVHSGDYLHEIEEYFKLKKPQD